jgi:hypothetical protein
MTVGSRAEVFHGNADKTPGGLSKKDLIMKDGRVVSKAASKAALARMKKEGKEGYGEGVQAQEVGFQASAQEWYR